MFVLVCRTLWTFFIFRCFYDRFLTSENDVEAGLSFIMHWNRNWQFQCYLSCLPSGQWMKTFNHAKFAPYYHFAFSDIMSTHPNGFALINTTRKKNKTIRKTIKRAQTQHALINISLKLGTEGKSECLSNLLQHRFVSVCAYYKVFQTHCTTGGLPQSRSWSNLGHCAGLNRV